MKEAIIVFLVVIPLMIAGLLIAAWLEPDNGGNGAWYPAPAIHQAHEHMA